MNKLFLHFSKLFPIVSFTKTAVTQTTSHSSLPKQISIPYLLSPLFTLNASVTISTVTVSPFPSQPHSPLSHALANVNLLVNTLREMRRDEESSAKVEIHGSVAHLRPPLHQTLSEGVEHWSDVSVLAG